MYIDTRAALVAELRRLAGTPDLQLPHLRAFAADVVLSDALLDDLTKVDLDNPYGRNVVHACEALECMVATWTRGLPCSPHDHGGSYGAVRVLRGQARHRIWSVSPGKLDEARAHTAVAGDVLACGPALVHSMGDDAEPQPLMTLHLYTQAIDHMVVYDLDHHDTCIVEGSCGAWIPAPESGLLRRRVAGILPRAEIRAA